MAYRESYKNDIDELVFNYIPDGPDSISVTEIVTDARVRFGTARNSLKRMLDAGEVQRRWDGNERYGRYVYSRPKPTSQEATA